VVSHMAGLMKSSESGYGEGLQHARYDNFEGLGHCQLAPLCCIGFPKLLPMYAFVYVDWVVGTALPTFVPQQLARAAASASWASRSAVGSLPPLSRQPLHSVSLVGFEGFGLRSPEGLPEVSPCVASSDGGVSVEVARLPQLSAQSVTQGQETQRTSTAMQPSPGYI